MIVTKDPPPPRERLLLEVAIIPKDTVSRRCKIICDHE